MDIATIVKEIKKGPGGEFPVYHIRISKKKDGPKTENGDKILEILQRKDGESDMEFYGRVRRFVDELPEDA